MEMQKAIKVKATSAFLFQSVLNKLVTVEPRPHQSPSESGMQAEQQKRVLFKGVAVTHVNSYSQSTPRDNKTDYTFASQEITWFVYKVSKNVW